MSVLGGDYNLNPTGLLKIKRGHKWVTLNLNQLTMD